MSAAHRSTPIARARSRGLSIIEVVITVAIMGILLAAAMPSVGAWMANTRVRNTAEALQNGLQQARTEALRRNQSVSFYLVGLTTPTVMDNSCALSSSGGSWVVAQTSPATKCANDESGTPAILAKHAAGDGGGTQVTVAATTTANAAAHTVTFNGFGQVTNSGAIGQINVTPTTTNADVRSLRIVVTTAGMVRMCDPSITAAADTRACPGATP